MPFGFASFQIAYFHNIYFARTMDVIPLLQKYQTTKVPRENAIKRLIDKGSRKKEVFFLVDMSTKRGGG